jgi:hypothetical protein
MAGLLHRACILPQAKRPCQSFHGGASSHLSAIAYLKLGAATSRCCSSAVSCSYAFSHSGRGDGVAMRCRWMQAGQQRPLAHEGAIHVASGPVQAEMAVDRGITIGQVALQGPREEMEDELVTESHSPSGFMYAAIFDDHAGFSSAQFLR